MKSDELSPRRQQTRSTLVRAGTMVFAVKGIAGASIEEICEAGGLTRGAFYSNFSSRDDLVLASLEIRTAETLDRLDDAIQRWSAHLGSGTVTDVEGLLTSFVEEILDEKNRTVADTIAEHEIELYCLRVPELYSRYQEFDSYRLERLSALVRTALDFVGAEPRIPLEELLSTLVSLFLHLSVKAAAGKELNDPLDIDPAFIVNVLMALLVFSPTGPEPA